MNQSQAQQLRPLIAQAQGILYLFSTNVDKIAAGGHDGQNALIAQGAKALAEHIASLTAQASYYAGEN